MEKYKQLKPTQRKFLECVKHKVPFSSLPFTIAMILDDGEYTKTDADNLNELILYWKEKNKKQRYER